MHNTMDMRTVYSGTAAGAEEEYPEKENIKQVLKESF